MGLSKVATSGRMYAESSEKKMSHARIAFALLCGLAVCCSVMYITADAGDEYMHEVINYKDGSGRAADAGTSVGSTDVLKAGQIYTETPDGPRLRIQRRCSRQAQARHAAQDGHQRAYCSPQPGPCHAPHPDAFRSLRSPEQPSQPS